MYVANIKLENFRNFKTLDLALDKGFVVLCGPNGAGKTNFLESIYYGGSLRRFPESSFSQLVRDGDEYFRITIDLQNQESHRMEALSQARLNKFEHQFKLNQQKVPRAKYTSFLSLVSFLPQDLALLTRSPGGRRNYLDESLSAASAEYRHYLSLYDRTLKQRNELLRLAVGTGGEWPDEMHVWDTQLAGAGSQITAGRKKFLEFVNGNIGGVLGSLSAELAGADFQYLKSGEENEGEFLLKLQANRAREKETASTAIGPHRDDFVANIGGRVAAGYLSRGQMRAITLALKILEKRYLEETLPRAPIMLLDDVFSEFDEGHQHRLTEFLETFNQVFLTTAHPEEVERFLPLTASVFSVDSGSVKKMANQHV